MPRVTIALAVCLATTGCERTSPTPAEMTVRIGGSETSAVYSHTFSIGEQTETTIALGAHEHRYVVTPAANGDSGASWMLTWTINNKASGELSGNAPASNAELRTCKRVSVAGGKLWLDVGVGAGKDTSKQVCSSEQGSSKAAVKAPVASSVPAPQPTAKPSVEAAAAPAVVKTEPDDPFKDFGKRPVSKVLAAGTIGEMAVGDPPRGIGEDLPGLDALPRATIVTANPTVQALLRRRATLFAFCAGSNSPAASGEVTFTVDAKGQTSAISAIGFTDPLQRCITARLKPLLVEGDTTGTHTATMSFAPR